MVRERSFYPTISGDLLSRPNLFSWIREFIRNCEMPSGYYMEFGVLNGECLVQAYRLLRGFVSHYYGFDSFSGLPALSPQDAQGLARMPGFREGNYHGGTSEQVHGAILASTGMSADELTLVPGVFEASLPAFDQAQLADKGPLLVAYVDCDLYSSSKNVFEFIEPLAVAGTWLLLDDYWCYRGDPRLGQRRAFEEFIASSPRIGATAYGNFQGFGRAFILYEK